MNETSYTDMIKAELQQIDLHSGNNGVNIDDESLSLLQKAEIDLSIDIPSPPPVLYQGNKVMISKGDFSVVVGAAKSRKTFCVSAMVGAYLCTDEYMNMSSPNDAGSVLWIDTEQSIYHAAKVAKRVCRIAGLPTNQKTDRFRMLCFREYEPGKRRELTDKAIEKVDKVLANKENEIERGAFV